MDNEPLFLKQVQTYMRAHGMPDCILPQEFDLSLENCDRVKNLLLKLQQNQVQDLSAPAEWIETLTNVLFEVLQHVGIIPGAKTEAL